MFQYESHHVRAMHAHALHAMSASHGDKAHTQNAKSITSDSTNLHPKGDSRIFSLHQAACNKSPLVALTVHAYPYHLASCSIQLFRIFPLLELCI